jgi:hypothetical protein
MNALIVIVLIVIAALAFAGFFFLVRWSLKRFDEHLTEQAAKHRVQRMNRYSMSEFRGVKGQTE